MSGLVRARLQVPTDSELEVLPDVCPAAKEQTSLYEGGVALSCHREDASGERWWCPALEFMTVDYEGRRRRADLSYYAERLRQQPAAPRRVTVMCRFAERGRLPIGAR